MGLDEYAEVRRRGREDPEWGSAVLAAVRQHFAEGRWMLESAQLIRAELDTPDEDGVPVLLATYTHPFWPERTGMRRRLDRPPVSGSITEGQSLAEWLAEHICAMEIGEPLGRRHDLLVEDNHATWWWGDGYPDPSTHPDLQPGGKVEQLMQRELRRRGR